MAALIIGAIYGVILGSYLSCALWRIPQRRSLLGRSVCAVCGRQLRDQDNVPVLSWLWLRGRSHCCQQPISIRYPAYELSAALGLALVSWIFGLITAAIVMAAIIILTVLASVIRGTTPTVQPMTVQDAPKEDGQELPNLLAPTLSAANPVQHTSASLPGWPPPTGRPDQD